MHASQYKGIRSEIILAYQTMLTQIIHWVTYKKLILLLNGQQLNEISEITNSFKNRKFTIYILKGLSKTTYLFLENSKASNKLM